MKPAGEMQEKKTRSTFDKVRLTLRFIGIFCGAFPVLAYFVFAISFQRIQTVKDYEASTVTVVKDLAYTISQTALPIANFSWAYILPWFFPILVFEIIYQVRRQMLNGERKMY
jgi:hypothetical protein